MTDRLDEKTRWFLNRYDCERCGRAWSNERTSEAAYDDCPECDYSMFPHQSEELEL